MIADLAAPSGVRKTTEMPRVNGGQESDQLSSFDALESMIGAMEDGRMSVGPGAITLPTETYAAAQPRPKMISTAPPGRGVTSGPGAARGISSGPGAARGISAGPGAARGGVSASPGAARGVVSSGPGAALLAAKKTSDSNLQIKPAEYGPDGRKLIYSGPPCAVCGEMILAKVTNALGKTYHPEHFKCKHCNKLFQDMQYLEKDENPYCEPCYWELFAARCTRCSLVIKEKCINACNKSYHSEHFTCTGCGVELAGKKYKEYEDEPYCNICYKDRIRYIEPAAHICAMCKKPIFGEYLKIHGQYIHPEHYKCEACGKDFINGDCHEYDNKLYCEEDWRKLLKNICFGCRKPIAGRSYTAMGRTWHPEHFVCAHCHEPFPTSNFYEHDGKPYCDLHFQQFFAKICGKCSKAIIGDCIEAQNKFWHPEHYVCTYCDKNLRNETIVEWEGKAMCRACYYKLPKDIRNKIEELQAKMLKAKIERERKERDELASKEKEEKKKIEEFKKQQKLADKEKLKIHKEAEKAKN